MQLVENKKYNGLELWLLSDKGKQTLNRFYSWGAAFVILGALFKFLDWPYANAILFFSMMTEVIVFFISGFEPYDRENNSCDSLAPSNKVFRPSSSYDLLTEEDCNQLKESITDLKIEHARMLNNLKELNARYQSILEAMGKSDAIGVR